MTEKAAHRIIDAFDTVKTSIYPYWYTEQMEQDVEYIRNRYNDLKWKMGFSEAMRQAQTEFILRVCEKDTP